MRKYPLFMLLLVLFLLAGGLPAAACTLWGANGSAVEHGGSLIIKNRDWKPDQIQSVRLSPRGTTYRFIGLYAKGDQGGLKAGVNERGLAVVSATAGSIPDALRLTMARTKGLQALLLGRYATVAEALNHPDLFRGPQVLMLADRHEVAWVEIGPEGRVAIERRSNGVLYHTNHYLAPALADCNLQVGKSSATRLERIAQLVEDAPAPVTFSTYLAFSRDAVAGPGNSIFRTGRALGATRTVAVWGVSLPLVGSPLIDVRLLDAETPERSLRIVADDVFAGRVVLPD